MSKKYLSLPVELVENDRATFDSSLIPVDLKVMHNGLNLNDCIFNDESIEEAKGSLQNKPILGYVQKIDGSDEKDFKGHETEVVINDKGIDIVFLERPLGLIPQTNNYAILEEDDKKYVYCRGYLWKEYLNSAYEVLRNNPKKSVSMEIVVDAFSTNADGTINIEKYRYLGVTILGESYIPAMTGAELTVVGQFSEQDNSEFYAKIEELNNKIKEYSNFEVSVGGGEGMKDEKVENVDEKLEEMEEFEEETLEEETLEDETFEDEALEDETLEDETLEEEVLEDEDFEEEETVEDEIEEDFDEDTEEAEEDEEEVENFTKTFELSHDDIRSKLYVAIVPQEQADEDWFYIIDVYDNHFVYIAEYKQKYYKQGYIKTDVDIALNGDRVEVFSKFLTQEELDILNAMKANYKLLEKENEELKEFKATKEKEAFEKEQERIRDEKINHINEEYPNVSDDVKDVFISKVDEYETIEDIDADMCVYIVKNKVTFSKAKKDNEVTKTKINQEEKTLEVSPYGSLF